MRTWRRAEFEQLCGLCHRQIAIGEPVLIISIGETIRLPRCAACVGPAPPDLPPLVERRSIEPQVMTRFGPGMLPIDFKHRQVGRDPGEEG